MLREASEKHQSTSHPNSVSLMLSSCLNNTRHIRLKMNFGKGHFGKGHFDLGQLNHIRFGNRTF